MDKAWHVARDGENVMDKNCTCTCTIEVAVHSTPLESPPEPDMMSFSVLTHMEVLNISHQQKNATLLGRSGVLRSFHMSPHAASYRFIWPPGL